MTTTTTRPVSMPYDSAQWPAFVGYGAFFAACCVLGVTVGYVIDRAVIHRGRRSSR